MIVAANDKGVLRGDGTAAVRHVVRIIVVEGPDGVQPSASSGNGQHGHGPSAAALAHAEAVLKKMPAPGSGKNPAPNAPKMFDVLEATDIVVIVNEPASVRGKGADRHVSAHNDQHRETVLKVWTESDTIEYQCAEPFIISRVEKAAWKLHGTPDHPFDTAPEYRALTPSTAAAGGSEPQFTWTSSVLTKAANNQQYKMSFKFPKRNPDPARFPDVEVDPDIVCGSPPPGD